MIHLGDITKISGYTAPTVDVVIGGSPCQDLSICGKRAGLDGERSGLFMEQIRIIKEMRKNDIRRGRSNSDVRPRYMVWENVPGALSSNKGEDFRIVLEETAKVADKNAVIPRPENGKWTTSGCIMADWGSISWRILDAQFWGVPQRRRRIALVADFGGQSAPEILFVRKSVSGDIEPSEPKRQGTSSDAQGGSGADDCTVEGFDGYNGQLTGDKAATLGVNCGVSTGRNGVIERWLQLDAVIDSNILDDQGGSMMSVRTDCKAPTLRAQIHGHTPVVMSPAVVYAVDQGGGKSQANVSEGTAPTLCTTHGGEPVVAYANPDHYIARRLTPREAEALQGFPGGWTDIGEWVDSKGKVKKTSDAARYKALGNSIAIPPWKWVLKRLCACYERDATMASLFDGIGGFPYIWEQINGKGSCLWASEIEEFPIAVTRVRFE